MAEVMSIRPIGRDVFHNGVRELALSYDGGKTWTLTTRRGEIPCDMEFRFVPSVDGTISWTCFGWDGTTTTEPAIAQKRDEGGK
jgi:hypothetical protein